MTITGTIPTSIAAFLNTENESLNGLEIKGNDIDAVFTDKGVFTEIYAVGMGNGIYEIVEIEDNLNLLPEYDEGDVISNDVLKKLFSTVINSSLILSFNPLGKIKYGIKDKINDVKGKVQKGVGKVKEFTKWLTDEVTLEDAQNYVRSQGIEKAKVGYIGKTIGTPKDGGYYTILFGNPADKNYYVWDIYKNGNEYRVLNQEAFSSNEGENAKQAGQLALDEFNNRTGGNSNTDAEDNDNTEQEIKETEEIKQPEDNDNVINNGDWQYNDEGIAYKVWESAKKKKKKLKYNGCNVTGYEDGTLISPMSVGDGGISGI